MTSKVSLKDDESVVLECRGPDPILTEGATDETFLSAADVRNWDLAAILSHQVVKVTVDRNRLIDHSSYFRGLLSGSFSEYGMQCVLVEWSCEEFLNILLFIHGCETQITHRNFLSLFRTALYFGVEALLLRCKLWFHDNFSCESDSKGQVRLDDLIHIWCFYVNHDINWIEGPCTSYIARNFMWVMASENFIDIPFNMFLYCIKHPHLTVDSERHFAEALLSWLSANKDRAQDREISEFDCSSILNEIRFCLLPLWFAMGRRRSCHFSGMAEQWIQSIFQLIRSSTSSISVNGDLSCMRIRLTEFTKLTKMSLMISNWDKSCVWQAKLTFVCIQQQYMLPCSFKLRLELSNWSQLTSRLDLSGCPQTNVAILLLSMCPVSCDLVPLWGESFGQKSIDLRWISWDWLRSHGWLPVLSFSAVQEIDISKCPRLDFVAAIKCFCKSFPSLRTLRAAYLPDTNISKLHKLVQNCPSICEVDLTVDVSPIMPSKVSIINSSSTRNKVPRENLYDASYGSTKRLSYITKLTLEGMTDVSDSDLDDISGICVSLCYLNIKGCYSVSDIGISNLICRCLKLHSVIACDTSFGRNSIFALCSRLSNPGKFPVAQLEKSTELSRVNLGVLHIGGCKDVDETSLIEILSHASMLNSLCLRNTSLVDEALYGFSGSSLEMLDVSETMVSGAALLHIVQENHGLKTLRARGCKHLYPDICTAKEGGSFSFQSCKELYTTLRKEGILEEFAIGWGFSFLSLYALDPELRSLKTITVGLGGSLGEEGLKQLPTLCPSLESVTLLFQVISDCAMMKLMEASRLQTLEVCYCIGEISPLSFQHSHLNLRRLKLERVTPWMTNEHLADLAQNCASLIELSLKGCMHLDADSQRIISCGWPGLILLHLEECGTVTAGGVSSLFDLKSLEDLLLRHNGPGIQRKVILDAASKLPMLRILSVDWCDVADGDLDLPDFEDRYSLSYVKIARCKRPKCALDILNSDVRRNPVHEETLVVECNGGSLRRTVVKERI